MKLLILICLACITVLQAQVPVPPPAPPVQKEDVRHQIAFASLNWYIGKGYLPNIVVGYRNTVTTKDNDVKGGSGSISYNLSKNQFDQFKIIGIYGNTDTVGEAGIGYSLDQKDIFGNIGLQGLYMDGGIDYYLNNQSGYYIGITTVND